MTDEPAQLGEISFARAFPWLRLFRALGISLDPKKLFLAVGGLLLLHAGWLGLRQTLPASRPGAAVVAQPLLPLATPGPPLLVLEPASVLSRLAEPALVVIGPFADVFSREADGRTFLHDLLAAAWAVAVWGIVGGAITRIAVVQATTGIRIGMSAALRFALGKVIALVGGPLSPLLGIAIVASPCMAFGLLYRDPGSLGQLLAGALFVIPLISGLLMTFILAGLAVGWPLILSAVAAEAQDGFDALSRSYAYVYQRTGRYAAYVALVSIAGVVGYVAVAYFAQAVVSLTFWGLSWTAPRAELETMLRTGTNAARLHEFWLTVVRLLVHGWSYAYFWSAAPLIYLLVRHDVDGTDWYQVAIPAAADSVSPEHQPAVAAASKGPGIGE